jgi:hypothetical protein
MNLSGIVNVSKLVWHHPRIALSLLINEPKKMLEILRGRMDIHVHN